MPSRFAPCRQRRQRVGHHPRGRVDQLIVVGACQEILPVFVRLPWRVQDAGEQASRLRWKERPEVSGIGQGFKGCCPSNPNISCIVQRAAVLASRIRKRVCSFPTSPPRRAFASVELELLALASKRELAGFAAAALERQVANMRHEQQELRRKLADLLGQIPERVVLEGKADDVGRPTHELAEIVVFCCFVVGIYRFR